MALTPHHTGCPVDPNRLKARRVTHCINVETGEIVECEDGWKTSQHPYFNPLDSGKRWTGWTEFELEDEEEVNEPMDQRVEAPSERASGSDLKRKAEGEGDDERANREETVVPKAGVTRKNEEVNEDDRDDKHHKLNDDDVNVDEIRTGLKLMGFNVDLVD